MSSNFKEKNELTDLEGLRDVIADYQEVSAIRMRKVKISVLENRDYLTDLNNVYQEAMASYMYYLKRVKKDLSQKKAKSDKSVLILMSSNTGLYGPVIRDTFDLFVKDVQANPKADVVIAGKLGKNWMDDLKLGREYTFIDMQDSKNEEYFRKLLSIVLDYGTVIVYHGFFESVLNQRPQKTYITGESLPQGEGKTSPLYLFEPSVEEVLDFFENQIFGILFEQALYESSLSKYASRMISLEASTKRIDDMLKKMALVERKRKFDKLNRAQQSLLSARSLWG